MTTTAPAEYRSKAVTIEAVQYDGSAASRTAIIEWIAANNGTARTVTDGHGQIDIEIKSIEGMVWAFEGWWVIRGTAGEFYPCRDDVFQAKYAPVVVQPMTEMPVIFGTRRENRNAGAIALSRQESNAIAEVVTLHEAEFVAALEPFGIDWRTVVMPDWERFLTETEVRAALESYDRTAGK